MLCDLLQCESSQPDEETLRDKIMKIRVNKALEKVLHITHLTSKMTFKWRFLRVLPFWGHSFFFFFFNCWCIKWDTESSDILFRIYFILCSSPAQDAKYLDIGFYWSFIITQVRNFPLHNFTCILRKTISFKYAVSWFDSQVSNASSFNWKRENIVLSRHYLLWITLSEGCWTWVFWGKHLPWTCKAKISKDQRSRFHSERYITKLCPILQSKVISSKESGKNV